MLLKDVVMSKEVDEYSFGLYVRKKREEMNESVRSFAKKLGCSAAYLSDIEKGNRYAPKNYLDKLFELLKLPEEEREDFENLAAATRGFIYADINSYFGQVPLASVALRLAIKNNANSEFWEAFIQDIEQ